MYLKPDLTATSFSAQNGYFFANMSSLAYDTPDKVESTLGEMEDCKGLQGNFQWFQVPTCSDTLPILTYWFQPGISLSC